MIRTLVWLFKKPQGLWEVLIYPKETIAWIKSYVVSNWYNDVLNSDVPREQKKTMLWFIHSKTGLKQKDCD